MTRRKFCPTCRKTLEDLLAEIFGFDRRESIREGMCVPPPIGCGEVADFSGATEIERKEYLISGLCPKCQREIFE